MSTGDIAADLFGIDLSAEVARLRQLNGKLAAGIAMAVIAGAIGFSFGLFAMLSKPEPQRIGIDPAGRVVPVVSLTKGDPPDAKITRMAGDCIYFLFNHAFHNYQTSVERTIGECFTGGGSESVRKAIMPFLERMKKDSVNMTASYTIHPFINSRSVMGAGANARNVFHIQGVISIGYRGGKENGAVQPKDYAFQTDVVRVSYDSHIEGIRHQNIILEPWERQR